MGNIITLETMSITLPSSDSIDAENDESDAEDTVFDERVEAYEDYWKLCSVIRVVSGVAETAGVPTFFKDAADESPLAAYGYEIAKMKSDQKAEIADMKDAGDLPEDANLPEYVDQFETPEYDHDVITAEDTAEWSLPDDHVDDDDPIFVPDDMDLPTNDDGTIRLEYNDQPASHAEAAQVLVDEVDGIGKKRAGRAVNALVEAGIIAEE